MATTPPRMEPVESRNPSCGERGVPLRSYLDTQGLTSSRSFVWQSEQGTQDKVWGLGFLCGLYCLWRV